MATSHNRIRSLDFGPLDRSLGYHLRRAQLQVFEDFKRIFAELEIRPTQFSVLVLTDKNKGASSSEIARALGILRTNFVELVAELEERGLIERKPSQRDRRSYTLHLTPRGAEVLRMALSAHESQEGRLRDILGPNATERLQADLIKIRNCLSSDRDAEEEAVAATPLDADS